MTLFERLRNGSSSEPTTANSANPAIPANSATQLAEISRNSSSSPPANDRLAGLLTETKCRCCYFPAPIDFRSLCPSCGTTHPFAADDEMSLTLTTAEWAVSQSALTPQQTAARLADLRSKPEIARFWAKLFDPTVETNLQLREGSRRG